MSSQLFSKPAARSLSTEPYRRPVHKCRPRRPAHDGELLERWAPSTLRSRVSPCTAARFVVEYPPERYLYQVVPSGGRLYCPTVPIQRCERCCVRRSTNGAHITTRQHSSNAVSGEIHPPKLTGIHSCSRLSLEFLYAPSCCGLEDLLVARAPALPKKTTGPYQGA